MSAHSFETIIRSSAKVRQVRGLNRQTRRAQDIWCDLASNDYVGLAQDPRVIEAGCESLQVHGASARASRVVCGTLPEHERLEASLAELTGSESGLAFSSGYTANLAVVMALGRPGTQVLMDSHVHASLHDAAKLSAAQVTLFDHQHYDQLETLLQRAAGQPCLIVVEGVYSVLGDAADMVRLHELAVAYDALVLLDESHSLGVRGDGRGLAAEVGLAGSSHLLVTSSLGKSLGSMGGVVLGSAEIRDYLVNAARTFIFDTGLAPVSAATAECAARIISQEGKELTQRLFAHARLVSDRLGIELSAGAVQSLPVTAGSAYAAAVSASLEKQGVLAGCFRPPSVPDGVARLRFTAHAHTPRPVLEDALDVIERELTMSSTSYA